ncbi:hypothetical protein STRTUCAR8_03661 [Streptomyces turgidiscabies Car8]|uniref:Uncharacterized protein n=1 Tax=Streptomyces turgidiscabies (strain Car8) TaxID=698760 RepID=L7ER57_STRT8|nr:hypothetical protein STRTUCAR8_03661 [Streptomyces turgidiscabies Car8]
MASKLLQRSEGGLESAFGGAEFLGECLGAGDSAAFSIGAVLDPLRDGGADVGRLGSR